MLSHPTAQQIELWPIERLVEYPRNPRKNDAAVDRMCASIREFGFKIPVPLSPDQVIFGCWDHTGYSAATLPARNPSPGFLASASRG
jgi:hypothetical protein